MNEQPLQNLTADKLLFLEHKALQLRIDSIRATTESGSGHTTSCLSAADIVSALFFHVMRYDPENRLNPNNDRFILSKGHATPLAYAAWKQVGVISDQQLLTLRDFDSVLEGHPTPRFSYNEASTGSLGQGLAIGLGMALKAKLDKLSYTTYVLMGDGETAEGSVWEAAELAGHYQVDNLVGIVDCNRLGQAGVAIDGHDVERYARKFEAFGWHAEIVDGHDMDALAKALAGARSIAGQPVMIVAKTYKGYGLDESSVDKIGFHGQPLKEQQAEEAIAGLRNRFKEAARYEQGESSFTPTPPGNHRPSEKSPGPVSIDLGNDPDKELFAKDKQMATRKAFGYGLAALGRASQDIITLDGDVSNSTYSNSFQKEFPDRFIQCFIAEQNMLGIATGLETRGKIPFAATFGAFFSRAFDQIRMAGIGRNALRLCGSHSGVSIGDDGPSQMALEDIALMRTVPNSVVLYPSDAVSAYKLLEVMANYNDGVSYMRTTRSDTPILYDSDEQFDIGGCKVLRQSDNDSACIVAAGITLHEALKAYETLKADNILVSVIDLYSIKPMDHETIRAIAIRSNNRIITVEDHYAAGGIGEAVASALQDQAVEILCVRHIPRSGKPQELLAFEEIDCNSIAEKVRELSV